MPPEPLTNRTFVFVGGQNLFHAARASFGSSYPNYDVLALARSICGRMSWDLLEVRFYLSELTIRALVAGPTAALTRLSTRSARARFLDGCDRGTQ
jgi:hypothetical protein